MIRTAVVFVIFNRPETTVRVFQAIREARPSVLMVVADGPRAGVDGENELCLSTRAIIERVDWPCELLRNYSETNLGCRRRVSSGLDWAFSMVEEAMILEDDCVPDRSFFRFCEELLGRYRFEDRVMHISGNNFLFGSRPAKTSYYFSRYPHIWGWASWRRAWKNYDVNMRAWQVLDARGREDFLEKFIDRRERAYWRHVLAATAAGEIDTWDYQLTFACMSRGGLSITPSVNLVANIGFGPGATHTRTRSPLATMHVKGLRFPLTHPSALDRDPDADRVVGRVVYRAPHRAREIASRLKAFALSARWG